MNPYMTAARETQPPSFWRYTMLGVGFALIGLLIVAQMFRLQVSPQAEDFIAQGKAYSRALHIYYPARGQIYDRWGSLLAGNTLVYEVGAQVASVENIETVAFALSKVLAEGHPEYSHAGYYDELYAVLVSALQKGTSYIPLADFVTPDELAQLQEWALRYNTMQTTSRSSTENQPSLAGLVYRPRLQRTYPEHDLASTIIGFVNREGVGLFGVEQKYNDLLAGEPVAAWVPLDPYEVANIPTMEPGGDLVLTIDRQTQAAVEEILEQALNETGASSGVIIVSDPNTGEILAMTSWPRLDLNEYWNYGEVFSDNTPFNRAVSDTYEPGSVYKVLTMAAGLDSGVVDAETVFTDGGSIEIGGILIHNWDYGAWGPQNMQGCMQHSLNVCLTWVAKQLGANLFYDYMQNFGIGHLTGVDMAMEANGRLKLPGDTDWYEADLGTNSFGQGVAVTPLQMVMAISAIANERGEMMAPHVVRSIINDGYQYNPAPQVVGTPIRAETARMLTEMLAASLENESSDALVMGYQVAGKTGTAEIPGPGGYQANLTNASFVGWGPVGDPKFLVYVWLEEPTVSPWGSVVASPVFREVVEQLVVLMDIPPDDIRRQLGNE
ncbi:MAG TPA: penicillin-binding protein 2 [Anaerolineales bacterium]|nr:penicillin-binding protein 2 [Anaerolineales bacterium]